MSSTEYCNNFRSCRIPLYQGFISQSDKGATASTLTIVGVNHTNIKCKYYSVWLRGWGLLAAPKRSMQYAVLEPSHQKEELALKSEIRGHKPGLAASSKVFSWLAVTLCQAFILVLVVTKALISGYKVLIPTVPLACPFEQCPLPLWLATPNPQSAMMTTAILLQHQAISSMPHLQPSLLWTMQLWKNGVKVRCPKVPYWRQDGNDAFKRNLRFDDWLKRHPYDTSTISGYKYHLYVSNARVQCPRILVQLPLQTVQ